jgi:melibiose permease/lactose/raffinose/galactose permease
VVALMFCLRPHGWSFVAFWAVFYFLWDAVFTLNDIGYWSMLPSLSSDEKERNRVTTLMSIFVSIGSFVMYGICSVLPNAGNYTYIYSLIAIPSCILFGISQILIFFLCKEKKRDPVQEEVSQKTKFKDLFLILKQNKPLRMSVIAILIYYTGSGLMIGIGTTYFYMLYGYGGDYGGTVALIFTVMYALGTLASQLMFTSLSKRFSKQTLLTASCILAAIAYVAFFFVSVPIFGDNPLAYNGAAGATGFAFALGGTMFLDYIPAFFFFFGEGIFYLVLLMMMQNSIEYNEWKFGERKEAVAFSWRPLDAKFSSAIQKGVIYLSLLVTGLYASVTSKISAAEQTMAEQISADPANAATYQNTAAETIKGYIDLIENWQLIVLGAVTVGSILVCLLAAYFVMHFGYEIDEKTYASIVRELDVRRKNDEAKKGQSAIIS